MIDEFKLEIVYRIEGNGVTKYHVIGETDNNKILVPFGTEMLVEKNQLFDEKIEAQFELFKRRIIEGTPIKNYKSSKYYEYYIERMKKEYPEYMI